LFHWRRDIEADIRIVMRAEGLTDLSIASAKEWARAFIKAHYPLWVPGHKLRPEQQSALGAAFENKLNRAKQTRDKLAWQE